MVSSPRNFCSTISVVDFSTAFCAYLRVCDEASM